MKNLMYIFVAVIAIGFIACDKNGMASSDFIDNGQNSILSFENENELLQTIEKIYSSDNKLKRQEWETEQNFKSFGTICDEFYASIDKDKFTCFEDAKLFIEKNNQYIQLITDENGDQYCETQEFLNPERYVMNVDKMYIIGDVVYKKIGDSYVTSDVSNIQLLKETKDISIAKSHSNLKVVDDNSENLGMQRAVTAGRTSDSGQKDSQIRKQHYRLKVWIETKKSNMNFYSTLSIKNYDRLLMIYWFMEAPITYSYTHNISDGATARPASSQGGNWITKSNCEPFFVRIDYNIPNCGNPYYTSYNIWVENSITYKGETKKAKVELRY